MWLKIKFHSYPLSKFKVCNLVLRIDTRPPGCILDLKNPPSIADLSPSEQCHPFLRVFGSHSSTLCLCEFVYTSAPLGFPGALVVKNRSANAGGAEDQIPSLGQEDPLKEKIATRSSILAWRIPWIEEPGGLQSRDSWRVWHDWSG